MLGSGSAPPAAALVDHGKGDAMNLHDTIRTYRWVAPSYDLSLFSPTRF